MKLFRLPAFFALLLLILINSAAAQKLKPQEVLQKHLDSIGTAAARGGVKSQIAVGDVNAKFITQKNLTILGRIVLASVAEKNFLGMSLNSSAYPLEKFSYDGKKSNVAFVQPGSRSVLGNFLQSNKFLIEDGILGGVLSNSWTLLNFNDSKAKLSFDGTKKIDDKEVYVVGYSPKGGSDLDIKMYFDKETFRHVRTEYKRIASATITGVNSVDKRGASNAAADATARQSETRLKVTEDYSDFRPEKDLTLPHKYRINYSVTGQNGTTEVEWMFDLTEFAFNQTLDAKTFNPDEN